MIRVSHPAIAAIALASITLAGCTPPPPPARPAPPPPPWKAPASRADSAADLEPLANQLDQQVAALPGENGTAHRKIVVGILDSLVKVLQLSNGPDQSPAFTNRLDVVKSSRDTIANQTIPRPRMEAAENQALVATVDALEEVSTRYLFDDDKLPDLVKTARAKVNIALGSQGPMHDLDASAGFNAVDSLVRAESDAFIARFGSIEARTRLAQRQGTPLPAAPETPAPTSAPTSGAATH